MQRRSVAHPTVAQRLLKDPRASGVLRRSSVLRASGLPCASADRWSPDDVLGPLTGSGSGSDSASGGAAGALIQRSRTLPRSDTTASAVCAVRDTTASAKSPYSAGAVRIIWNPRTCTR